MKKDFLVLYESSNGKKHIIEYILGLDNDLEQVQLLDLFETINECGAKYLLEKNNVITKKLDKDLFEIKVSKHRFAYCYMKGNKVYILHAFRKNKQKTEKADLELARMRLKEVKRTT